MGARELKLTCLCWVPNFPPSWVTASGAHRIEHAVMDDYGVVVDVIIAVVRGYCVLHRRERCVVWFCSFFTHQTIHLLANAHFPAHAFASVGAMRGRVVSILDRGTLSCGRSGGSIRVGGERSSKLSLSFARCNGRDRDCHAGACKVHARFGPQDERCEASKDALLRIEAPHIHAACTICRHQKLTIRIDR
jgi:hypothetical protein